MSNIKELIRQKIDAYYAEYKDKFHQNGDPYHLGIIDGLDIAERILDTLPDEPITTCNELAEAAEKYGSDYPAYNDDQFIAENAFKAGAEWMKQKMMEGAANAYILKSYNPATEQGEPTLHAIEIELVYEDEGKPYLIAGQKARIIILPKEDE